MQKVSRFLSLTEQRLDAKASDPLGPDLELRQFSAMVAHEMRNFMAPLVYGAALLGRTEDRALTLRVRRDILVSVAHLRRLVDDLLTASGCEKGRMALVKTFVDLRDVMSTSVELVRPMFPMRSRPFDVEAPDTAVLVNGDFCRLTQVVSNLLINAIKFTPDEGAIRMVLARDGQAATIAVKDSGIGIEHEALGRIFEAFNRGSEEGAETTGLGLGLTIARQLVELHGGQLTVSSAGKDRGSEFVVRLPTVALS